MYKLQKIQNVISPNEDMGLGRIEKVMACCTRLLYYEGKCLHFSMGDSGDWLTFGNSTKLCFEELLFLIHHQPKIPDWSALPASCSR